MVAEIKNGSYKSASASWVSGLTIASAEDVVVKWAQESNAYVCSTVLADGLSSVENTDLSGSYTTTAAPIVDSQMAKQGYR